MGHLLLGEVGGLVEDLLFGGRSVDRLLLGEVVGQ